MELIETDIENAKVAEIEATHVVEITPRKFIRIFSCSNGTYFLEDTNTTSFFGLQQITEEQAKKTNLESLI